MYGWGLTSLDCITYICIAYALHNALRNLIAYLTAPPWGPHREAPVSPQGGGPRGYRATHITASGSTSAYREQIGAYPPPMQTSRSEGLQRGWSRRSLCATARALGVLASGCVGFPPLTSVRQFTASVSTAVGLALWDVASASKSWALIAILRVSS